MNRMNKAKLMLLLMGSMLFFLFMVSCSTSTSTPPSSPTTLPHTSTPIPPTPTPTPSSVPLSSWLLGEWESIGFGQVAAMTFELGKIQLFTEGDSGFGTYTVDFSFEPAHLDLQLEDVGKVLTIIEFVDDNTIRIENNSPGQERPSAFSDEAFLLSRVQVTKPQVTDHNLSLLLNLEALRLDDNPRTRNDLLSNLQYDPAVGTIRGHSDVVTSIAFSPDGTILASASNDLSILLWDTATWEILGEPILGHQAYPECEIDFEWYCPGEISSLAFSPDGSILASAGRDGTVRLWDPTTGESLNEPLTGHEDWVSQIAFSPDGTLLASASWDQTVRLWDPLTGEQIGDSLIGHNEWVSSVAFSPDGSMLASGDWDNTIIIWDPETGKQVQTITALQSLDLEQDWRWWDIIWEVAFSPDGEMLASTTCGGRNDGLCMVSLIELWDPISGEKLDQILTGFLLDAQDIAFSTEGSIIVSLNDLGPIGIWDPRTGKPLADAIQVSPMDSTFEFYTDLAFSPDGQLLATAGCGLEGGGDRDCAKGEIRLWDPVSEVELSQTFSRKFEVLPWFNSLIYRDNGEVAIALRANISSTQASIILLDPVSGDQFHETFIDQDSFLRSGVFSRDGSLFAGWYEDHTIQLWDVTTGESIGKPLRGHTGYIICAAFSPDGNLLASISYDDTIRIWDTSTGLQVGEPLTGDIDGFSSVLFSPDGNVLVSAGMDDAVLLWNPLTGEQIGEPFSGDFLSFDTLAFSPDGKLLAAAGNDIRVWDIDIGEQIGEPLYVSDGQIMSLAIDPNDTLLAVASCLEEDMGSSCVSSEIFLWDLVSGDQIGNSFREGISLIGNLVFSADGNQLMSLGCGIGDDQIPCSVGEFRWWDLDIESWEDRACKAAGRNLTISEWDEYFPGASYHVTCQQWPAGE